MRKKNVVVITRKIEHINSSYVFFSSDDCARKIDFENELNGFCQDSFIHHYHYHQHFDHHHQTNSNKEQ